MRRQRKPPKLRWTPDPEPSPPNYWEEVYDTMKRQRDAALYELNSRANIEMTAKRVAEATDQFVRTVNTLREGREAAAEVHEYLANFTNDLKDLTDAITKLRLQVRGQARRTRTRK